MKAMNNKNYSLDCSESRFIKLSRDLDKKNILPRSISETKIALEGIHFLNENYTIKRVNE